MDYLESKGRKPGQEGDRRLAGLALQHLGWKRVTRRSEDPNLSLLTELWNLRLDKLLARDRQRVEEHQTADRLPEGFVLDLIGSLAVNQVGQVAWSVIEELAASRGVKASIPLNPGTSHWPLSGNDLIVQLIPAAEMGVEALESGLLRPFKSISYVVALGKDVLTPDKGSSCDYCDNRELCRTW